MPDVAILVIAGFLMGFFGSIPLTGPIAVMAVNQAVKRRFMRGFVIGVGGTAGELIYCTLAVAGVGAMINQIPSIRIWVRGFSAVLLLGVGVYFFYHTPEDEDAAFDDEDADLEAADSDYLTAFSSAFSVAAFNPVLLLNWTAAVAFVFSHFDTQPTFSTGAAFVGSIGVGVIGWYAVLMRSLQYFREQIPTRALVWIQRIMSVFVITGALYLGIRTGMNLV